ncbi:hypothetical protein HMPREF9237_01273 [Actinotignum schaalii FB123-CNA-2]|uniref:FAD/NAD(P)-binding domain-containing protein n=3 Tax=Actinomycetaceae TaxID=2049 RepID=S2VGV0_9ACTO|nr:hypothetical protein HMPREF9237_01273 [Actinotignum schaalii FB123-CNA-2]
MLWGMSHNIKGSALPHVVIVGGGFAGIQAARGLRQAPVRVTLIDKNPYTTFKPLLFQVAAGALNAGDITYNLRALRSKQKNLRFVLGELQHVDTGNKLIELDDERTMSYDYLVLATGVSAAYFGIQGAAEHTLPMYTRDEALAVRDRLYGLLDGMDAVDNPGPFRVVVCGAGPTGVETAGAIAELRNFDFETLYPGIDTEQCEIILVDMAPTVLGPFDEKSRNAAHRALEDRGVKVLLNQAVSAVEENRILVKNTKTEEEQWIDASLIVWSSGVGVPPEVKEWNVPQGARGRIQVNEHFQVEGVDGVFAAGDVAVSGERGLPQLAQPAIQGGRHIAKVISNNLAGKETEPFDYFDKGTMATVGVGFAVTEIPHLPAITGKFSWLMWNAVHIQQLQSGREMFATFTNLVSKYFLFPKRHDVIVGDFHRFSRRARQGIVSASPKLDAQELEKAEA